MSNKLRPSCIGYLGYSGLCTKLMLLFRGSLHLRIPLCHYCHLLCTYLWLAGGGGVRRSMAPCWDLCRVTGIPTSKRRVTFHGTKKGGSLCGLFEKPPPCCMFFLGRVWQAVSRLIEPRVLDSGPDWLMVRTRACCCAMKKFEMLCTNTVFCNSWSKRGLLSAILFQHRMFYFIPAPK